MRDSRYLKMIRFLIVHWRTMKYGKVRKMGKAYEKVDLDSFLEEL